MIKNTKFTILLMFLLLALIIPTKAAIAPQPRIDLDEYEKSVSSTSNVYIEGTVSFAKGQYITLHTSVDDLPINFVIVSDSGKSEDFKIKVPKMFLKEGTNTFYVQSRAVENVVSDSNFKTMTIKVAMNSAKKSQTITASNKTMSVGQTLNLNAKASSGLKLKYKSNNQNVTVDSTGKMIARKVGTTVVTILQEGNNTYKSTSKTVTITVQQKAVVKKTQVITASNKTVKIGKSVTLKAKTSSGLKLTYKSSNPKVASVNSKGVVTGKKAGKAVITIKQAGDTKFKAASKKIVIIVPKIKIKMCAIKGINTYYVYTAKSIKPNPVIKYNNKKLKKNVDYSVTYKNTVKEGTAIITIRGKNNYSGSTIKRFKIYKKSGDGYKEVATLNGKVHKLYLQYKGSYRNTTFGNRLPADGSIANSGCGPSSIAIVISGYGYNLNPGQVGKQLISTTKSIKGQKKITNNRVFVKFFKNKNFKVKAYKNYESKPWTTTKKELISALSAKHDVVYWVGRYNSSVNKKYWKKFTSSGYHYIALLDINKAKTKIYVGNPNGKGNRWYDINTLAKACSNYRGWVEVWK